MNTNRRHPEKFGSYIQAQKRLENALIVSGAWDAGRIPKGWNCCSQPGAGWWFGGFTFERNLASTIESNLASSVKSLSSGCFSTKMFQGPFFANKDPSPKPLNGYKRSRQRRTFVALAAFGGDGAQAWLRSRRPRGPRTAARAAGRPWGPSGGCWAGSTRRPARCAR